MGLNQRGWQVPGMISLGGGMLTVVLRVMNIRMHYNSSHVNSVRYRGGLVGLSMATRQHLTMSGHAAPGHTCLVCLKVLQLPLDSPGLPNAATFPFEGPPAHYDRHCPSLTRIDPTRVPYMMLIAPILPTPDRDIVRRKLPR